MVQPRDPRILDRVGRRFGLLRRLKVGIIVDATSDGDESGCHQGERHRTLLVIS